jgi:2-dehydropantoate 2-reductase
MNAESQAGGQPIRTTVVGAGAVGSLLAAALVQAGHRVSVLARGDTLAAIRANGIRIVAGDAPAPTVPVQASDDPAVIGEQDIVVIALKAQALPALAESLRPMIGPSTLVVSAMNGLPWWFLRGRWAQAHSGPLEAVDPGGRVSAMLPAERAIGCVVHLSSATVGPGIVKRGRGNRLIIGAADMHYAHAAREFADVLVRGGFDVEVSENIRADIWAKLWGNMNMNPLSALTGSTADRLLDDPFTHALVLRMMEEADAIGQRLGLSTDMSAPQRLAVTRELGVFKTSMLQDFEAGRPLEVEPILGVFPELGRRVGVPTPFCDAVLGLLRQRAANSGV